ncbi:MAG: IS200/IS605 family transposase [Patescibacteria group bacterium]
MRKENPTRYSSAVGESWQHAMFKIKYCHKIFDFKEVREECDKLFEEASEKYEIPIEGKGFDSNHVHMKVDIGIYSKPEVAKKLRGYVARKLFQKFPWMKKPKREGGLFWNSGLWNPSYYIGSPKNLEGLDRYLKKQKWYDPSQTRLSAY